MADSKTYIEESKETFKSLLKEDVFLKKELKFLEKHAKSLGINQQDINNISDTLFLYANQNKPDEKKEEVTKLNSIFFEEISNNKIESKTAKIAIDIINARLFLSKNIKKSIAIAQKNRHIKGATFIVGTFLTDIKEEVLNHQFYTKEIEKKLKDKKAVLLLELDKRAKKIDKKKDALLQTELNIDKDHLKELKKKLKKVEGRPDRGIETLFRLASRNLYTRAKILDSKSGLLISINAIILSLLMGKLVSEIHHDFLLIIPILTCALVNLLCIAFGVNASMPIVPSNDFSRENVLNKKAQLLNFDNYYDVGIEDYQWAIRQTLEDEEYLYNNIVWDIHTMGVRIHDKYQKLRTGYLIFFYGLIIVSVLFLVTNII